MKKKNGKRWMLTIVFCLAVLLTLIITMTIVVAGMLLLARKGYLPESVSSFQSLKAVFIFHAVASVVVGTIITVFVSRIPLYPANKLIDYMNRLAAGDYSTRIHFGRPLGNNRTTRELTDSFNKLAQQLESTQILRSDFINNFSHEFKTPIVSIAGFAKLIRRGDLTDAQKEEYLAIIEEESLRLSYMATNVLNLTRVENQTVLTDVTEYNLSEQLRSCILLLEQKWERKNQEFSLEFGEHMVRANEELMKQVWINLIDNAVKFSPEGSTITVEIWQEADTLCVCVANPGKPISPEHQKMIFNKFYQADESHSAEGNGIGLAIVQGITRLHGGTVEVDSGPKKTVFTVRLPIT